MFGAKAAKEGFALRVGLATLRVLAKFCQSTNAGAC